MALTDVSVCVSCLQAKVQWMSLMNIKERIMRRPKCDIEK